ncbi:hypothetical protein [Absidia glauca]|uniref:Uncharacterized protein n=1 Tax=Absidia glauca TaxID=4829 RepID=A0A163J6W5_ABSGL|nr:hypothetical protein [Absidia glauca]
MSNRARSEVSKKPASLFIVIRSDPYHTIFANQLDQFRARNLRMRSVNKVDRGKTGIIDAKPLTTSAYLQSTHNVGTVNDHLQSQMAESKKAVVLGSRKAN